MLKRKPSQDLSEHNVSRVPMSHPTAAPTPMKSKRKRLFRSKNNNQNNTSQTIASLTPGHEYDMSDLLDFVLNHQEAFKNQYRLASLYADFRQQLEINPEGYHANIAAWIQALTEGSRAGLCPPRGTAHELLSIRANDELARSLQHPQHGKPTCLPAVFHEAVQRREMLPQQDFLSAKESIYKTTWLPSPWKVFQWSLRQVGVLSEIQSPDKLKEGSFVVIKNVEAAAAEILKKMDEHTSNADRVLSRADFLKRFGTALNPHTQLTAHDLDILLVFLSRDKQAVSYNAHTIKFKSEREIVPQPITDDDTAIANLRDTLEKMSSQIPLLLEKVAAADAAAREAVSAKQMVRAKAALRSKKLAENALAQRSDVALQLESVYTDLQHASDQVEIVEAMRAGAAALKELNNRVGGAEGVQGVVDAVNEQMATTDEITNIINETDQPLDEAEIDDEFEALEKADKEKREAEEAQKTAARLEELKETERNREESQKQKEEQEQEQEQKEQKDDERVESEIRATSQEFSKLSFLESSEQSENRNESQHDLVPA